MILAAARPALGQVSQIGEGDCRAGLTHNREEAPARPEHESGPAVGSLEGGPFVAGRLMKVLLVRLQVVECIRRTEFLVPDGNLTQHRGLLIGSPPCRQAYGAVEDFDLLKFVFVRLRPATVRGAVTCVLCTAALFDRNQRQVQIAIRRLGGSDENRRRSCIGAFQRPKPKLSGCIGMLERKDKLFWCING